MSHPEPFLTTKLHIPLGRKDLVVRSHLINQFVDMSNGPLTLIAAPAGYGKTTLVAAGLVASLVRAAWFSLDKDDNQLDRFLGYLLRALKKVYPRNRNGIYLFRRLDGHRLMGPDNHARSQIGQGHLIALHPAVQTSMAFCC